MTNDKWQNKRNSSQLTNLPFVVFLSLGSNLGNKSQNLQIAIQQISTKIGTIVAQSSVFETEPWGFESSHSFYNMAIKAETKLSPFELLHISKEIEKSMGRTKKSQKSSYEDRIIDIDIIMYDNLIITTEDLTLPHPRFHQRKFVLEPIQEIAPELVHPALNKTMKELLDSILTIKQNLKK